MNTYIEKIASLYVEEYIEKISQQATGIIQRNRVPKSIKIELLKKTDPSEMSFRGRVQRRRQLRSGYKQQERSRDLNKNRRRGFKPYEFKG